MATRKKASGRTTTATKSPEISLRLDGGDVHPHNVDPSLVLALASASMDPVEAWDQWFKQSAGEWNEDSVEALLGGRRD